MHINDPTGVVVMWLAFAETIHHPQQSKLTLLNQSNSSNKATPQTQSLLSRSGADLSLEPTGVFTHPSSCNLEEEVVA